MGLQEIFEILRRGTLDAIQILSHKRYWRPESFRCLSSQARRTKTKAIIFKKRPVNCPAHLSGTLLIEMPSCRLITDISGES
jgi:hypothetical protein